MISWLLRVYVLLVLVLVLAITLVIAIPYDDSEIQAFMMASENCGGTCLLGIQIGTTTVSETMNRLHQHSWVGEVRQIAPGNGYGQITWTWSGQQPSIVNVSRDGRATFYLGR